MSTYTSTSTAVTTALKKTELKAGGQLAAIVPQDAEQAYRMAQLIIKSGIAPKGLSTPEAVATAIFHGLEVGMKPMQAVQSIAVINGRPTVWGDAALGMVSASGLLENIEEVFEGEDDNLTAICRAKRCDRPSPIDRTFSVADAKLAGLWGKQGPWKQYPKRMLQMRARSWALRDGFADVLKGMLVTEEARDFKVISPDADATNAAPVTADDIIAQAGGQTAQPRPEPKPVQKEPEMPEPVTDTTDDNDDGWPGPDTDQMTPPDAA